ncbi:phage head-tail connector protein [Clostridium perfringens]|uniref:phage head-tail connector protein n=1 Tax=Clostridium perfringens TaxID=1502 RepID=UPI0013E29D8E|nr:hypothetical protein [Clostridium perfringens]NGT56620.1 hypothetical protein [Clostridium perfringens]NGT56694.1 hypothetical protein [Clostridium perfringens]NGT56768.1 hypothetical protein [Clostridium perfringens]
MNEIIQDLLIDIPKASPNKLELLIKRAINQINNYLNKNFNESDSIKNFKYAIEQIVLDTYLYQQSKQYKDGIVRITEGERSVEYKSTSSTGRVIFTDEVKAMLPTPYVRLMG